MFALLSNINLRNISTVNIITQRVVYQPLGPKASREVKELSYSVEKLPRVSVQS
jgi:hypothetical protein